jgi:hypothetical protein
LDLKKINFEEEKIAILVYLVKNKNNKNEVGV